ncbi:MAG: hypothetical protein A2008_06820 [Candidatus Wallbacteria bacterium GWC2_49_35]|uniref:6-bladed beta-propeller n=1 Tax=Candidatus Wallbacteria bacterium GWC2_49_35 TaxID=1817813 RepID=A0A1F7WNI6_9BACT|nr:MAG: hypothetical protein A2008_06820 [Candidatus Wallbacteria bacterium GWC2_49_35]HBC73835.1 hypothetical protein [Candidatus Wallbacteria bacterium]
MIDTAGALLRLIERFRFSAAAIFLQAAVVFLCAPCFAAGYAASTVITANAGSAPEEFFIKSQGESSYSQYFANGAPAFCVAGRLLYILDAANSRVKKYSLSGDFNSLVKLSAGFDIKWDELCGIAAGGSGEIIVHTAKEIYRADENGKITGRAQLEGAAECGRIFEWDPKYFTAYDYKNLRIYSAAADFEKKTAAIISSFDNILFPWPVSNEEFLSPSLLSPGTLCVYRYRYGGEAGSPSGRMKIASSEFVSQFKFIGRDGGGNFYLRYFGDITEKIAVIAPNLRAVETIVMDPAYSSKRSNMLYDECVGSDGCIYTLFIDSERLIVKKIAKSE